MRILALVLTLLLASSAFAIDFPNSPSDGQTYSIGGKTWKYESANGAWEVMTTNPLSDPLTVNQGGTAQTTEAEALGEMTQSLTEDTEIGSEQQSFYVPAYDSSSDTGKKLRADTVGGWTLIVSGSFSAVASIAIPLDTTNYDTLRMEMHNFKMSTDAIYWETTLSRDGGSSYITSANAYAWTGGHSCTDLSDGTDCGDGDNDYSDTACGSGQWGDNGASSHYEFYEQFIGFTQGNYIQWQGDGLGMHGGDGFAYGAGWDCVLFMDNDEATYTPPNYIKYAPTSGTISGNYALYGYRGVPAK